MYLDRRSIDTQRFLEVGRGSKLVKETGRSSIARLSRSLPVIVEQIKSKHGLPLRCAFSVFHSSGRVPLVQCTRFPRQHPRLDDRR